MWGEKLIAGSKPEISRSYILFSVGRGGGETAGDLFPSRLNNTGTHA
jgi:hypothetical protein